MKTLFGKWLLGVVVLAGACSSGEVAECEVGTKGCPCYTNRACNSGLSCETDTCREDQNLGGGGSGDSGESDTSVANTATSSGGSQNDGGTFGGGSGGTRSSGGSANGGSGGQSAATIGGTEGSSTASTTAAGGAGPTNTGGATSTSDTGSAGSAGEGSVEAVNLHLMVDSTASMVDNEIGGVTRWDFVTDGIYAFLESPELSGYAVNVGIQFFAWLSDYGCDVANYSTALVEIGPVAEVSAEIRVRLEDQYVAGLTPTAPALEGAISYAKSWAANAPNDHTAVVFLTDGYPTECEPLDLPSIADLAAASYTEAPSVPVHIVTMGGVYNFDVVAEAGGTNQAFTIAGDADPTQLTDALVSIATSPFGD